MTYAPSGVVETTSTTALTVVGGRLNTDAVLDWSDTASTEWGFKNRTQIDAGSFLQIATTSVDTIHYVNSSLGSGTYTYRVRAYNGVGNSLYTNEASTTIP